MRNLIVESTPKSIFTAKVAKISQRSQRANLLKSTLCVPCENPLRSLRLNKLAFRRGLIVGLLIFLPLQILSGQDKIITIQNDTILCKIVSVSSSHIQYKQKGKNQYTVAKKIPTEEVLEYFSFSKSPKSTERPWVIGLQFGGSSLLASPAHYEYRILYTWDGVVAKQSPDYSKQVNLGWGFKGDIHYMFSNFWGLGVKYSSSIVSSQNEFAQRDWNLSHLSHLWVILDQRQFIHYAGPSVIFRQWLNIEQKLQLSETFSAGYIHYRDELLMDSYFNGYYPYDRALFKNNTWGLNAGLSLDYYLVSWLSIGANVGFTYAHLSKLDKSTVYTHTNSTIELEKQPLSLLDFLFSIRFYFFN